VLASAAVAEDSSFLQLANTSSADNKIKLRTIACFFIDSPPGPFPQPARKRV
jgi:hypothetical protein